MSDPKGASAAVSAIMGKAKLHGLLVDKQDHSSTDGSMTPQRIEIVPASDFEKSNNESAYQRGIAAFIWKLTLPVNTAKKQAAKEILDRGHSKPIAMAIDTSDWLDELSEDALDDLIDALETAEAPEKDETSKH